MTNRKPANVLDAVGQAVHEAARRRDFYRVSRLSQAAQHSEALNLARDFGAADRTEKLARVLATVLSTEQLAGVLNGLLCVDADERLSDELAAAGGALFDQLCDLSPEAVSLASGGTGFHSI
jgi:hypothetical protein